MNLLSKLGNALSGGLASTVLEGIQAYFPPDMSDEQKAAMKLELEKIELEREIQVNHAIAESEKAINERIAQYEGTANDLKALPFVGRIVLFLRGLQRPMWGYATMYCDFMWFSGQWSGMTQQQESALWVINILVLGFLFGERAVKNVMPLVSQYFGKK